MGSILLTLFVERSVSDRGRLRGSARGNAPSPRPSPRTRGEGVAKPDCAVKCSAASQVVDAVSVDTPSPRLRGEGWGEGASTHAWGKRNEDPVGEAIAEAFDCRRAKLWQYIRSRSLAGFKFVRQEPIGPYIVDFACREKRLVIEIDGGQHADNRGDAARDRWLWSIATACSASGTMKCWKISKASGIRSSRLRMRQRPLTPTLTPHAGRGSRQAGPRNQTGLRIQAGPQNDSRPAERGSEEWPLKSPRSN